MSLITPELLKQLFPNTDKKLRDRWIPHWNKILPLFKIDNELRVAAFLATVGVESAYLRTTTEYASGNAYDITVNPKKARELGNTAKGDGALYKGRGGIQRTGKNNYRRFNEVYGAKFGIDFLANPEKVANFPYAVISDCLFWADNKLNARADRREFYAISGIVNKGTPTPKTPPLGWHERRDLYERALRLLPDNFDLETPLPDYQQPKPAPTIEQTIDAIRTDVPLVQVQTPTSATATTATENATQSPQAAPLESVQTESVNAPAKEGSTSNGVKMVIAGFTVPAFLQGVITALQSAITNGFIAPAEIGSTLLQFAKDNTKYVFIGIFLILVGMMLKKGYRQVTLWLQMYFAASRKHNNVEVIPQ